MCKTANHVDDWMRDVKWKYCSGLGYTRLTMKPIYNVLVLFFRPYFCIILCNDFNSCGKNIWFELVVSCCFNIITTHCIPFSQYSRLSVDFEMAWQMQKKTHMRSLTIIRAGLSVLETEVWWCPEGAAGRSNLTMKLVWLWTYVDSECPREKNIIGLEIPGPSIQENFAQ